MKNSKKKHDLSVELISDVSGTICDNFGVWVEKSMYGKNIWALKGQLLFDEELNFNKILEKSKS